MSRSLVKTVEVAFRLHEEGHLTREELVGFLEECVNATAVENGYADAHGLPFPTAKPEAAS